jgi:hypothetical protein
MLVPDAAWGGVEKHRPEAMAKAGVVFRRTNPRNPAPEAEYVGPCDFLGGRHSDIRLRPVTEDVFCAAQRIKERYRLSY